MAYVSEYGNYGAEEVLVFDPTELTVAQWDTLAEITDSEKLDYVKAIIECQWSVVESIEEQYK